MIGAAASVTGDDLWIAFVLAAGAHHRVVPTIANGASAATVAIAFAGSGWPRS